MMVDTRLILNNQSKTASQRIMTLPVVVSMELELYTAAGSGDLQMVKLLIQDGADVKWRKTWPSDGDSALHQAALRGHLDVVNELLDAGADALQVDDRGRTALHIAANAGKDDVVKRLLDTGHDPDLCDFDGVSPLHLACSGDFASTVRILTNSGAETNRTNQAFSSPLILAASYGHLECIKVLLDSGADINLKDQALSQATHAAANWGHEDCLSYLIRHGADVDSKDENDSTALFLAADNENMACMDVLITSGADCLCAIDHAAKQRQWRTVELLLHNTDQTPSSEVLLLAIGDVRLSIVAICIQRSVWVEESEVVANLVSPVMRKGALHTTDMVEELWLQHVYTDSRLDDLLELLELLYECGLISARTVAQQHGVLDVDRQLQPSSLKNMCAWHIRKAVHKQRGEAYNKLGLPSLLVEYVAGQHIIDKYEPIPPIEWSSTE